MAPAANVMTGHVLTDMQGGFAIDLPTVWKGRYRVTDSLAPVDTAIERRLTLRFVRADSSVVASPLLVIHLVKAGAWNAMAGDAAHARYGTVVARDATHLLTMRPASENPLTPGTADALAYDTLMMQVLQRPVHASMRR